jgi:hypothetical protein
VQFDTSANGSTYFLDLFGRPARNVVYQCERSDAPTIGQILHIMNGKGIQDRIASKDNHIGKLIAAGKTDAQILEDVYLATLGRYPGEREKMIALLDIDLSKDRRLVWEHVQWALHHQKDLLVHPSGCLSALLRSIPDLIRPADTEFAPANSEDDRHPLGCTDTNPGGITDEQERSPTDGFNDVVVTPKLGNDTWPFPSAFVQSDRLEIQTSGP